MDKRALIIAALLFVLIVCALATYASLESEGAQVTLPAELLGE